MLCYYNPIIKDDFWQTIHFILIVVAMALMNSGCGPSLRILYEGAPRQMEEICLVKAKWALEDWVIIKMVDGKPCFYNCTQVLELLPGKHSFGVHFSTSSGNMGGVIYVTRSEYPQTLDIDCRAGHAYEIGYRIEGERWHPIWYDVTFESDVQEFIHERIVKKRRRNIEELSYYSPQKE